MKNQLTGAAGEYLVAAELSRLRWAASITPKGVYRSDVLAQHVDTKHVVAIQAKTANGDNFRLNVGLETPTDAENEWFVFVALRDKEPRAEFYIVPRNVVAAFVFVDHRRWLAELGRGGRAHKDSPQRNVHVGHVWKYRDGWDRLHGSSSSVPYLLPDWFFESEKRFGLPDGHPGIVSP